MADFQARYDEFREMNILLIAASADNLEDARATAGEFGVEFPVGYDLLVRDVAATTGAYFEPAQPHLHATGVVVQPDGRVASALYSTGPVGRYTSEDCLGLIKHLAG